VSKRARGASSPQSLAHVLTHLDEQTGYLFSDGDPEDVAVLEAVQIDISGRIDGTADASDRCFAFGSCCRE
jgi:hypothetical protein